MYNLIECSGNYLKPSGGLWQYYRADPVNTIQKSESFKSKIQIEKNVPNNDNKETVEISVLLEISVLFRDFLKCY